MSLCEHEYDIGGEGDDPYAYYGEEEEHPALGQRTGEKIYSPVYYSYLEDNLLGIFETAREAAKLAQKCAMWERAKHESIRLATGSTKMSSITKIKVVAYQKIEDDDVRELAYGNPPDKWLL